MWVSLPLLFALQAGVPTVNGQPVASSNTCQAIHLDKAVNTALTLTVPAPSNPAQFVYICGWDLTVSADNTGTTVASNLQWTTTNLNGLLYTYSFVGTANTFLDHSTYYTQPVKAQTNGQAVLFVSPAAAAHNAYSINVYYRYGF